MLTNLNFLKPGEKFPPESEKERIQMYSDNRRLFETNHADVYKYQLKRIERVIGNFEEIVNYPIVLNFQKKMTLKIADLLLGEPPEISVGDEGTNEQKAFELMAENSDLLNIAYECVIDTSRFGDGLFYVRSKIDPVTNKAHGIIDVAQTDNWYPICSPDNVREFTHHVMAWEEKTTIMGQEATQLKVQIHTPGKIEKRVYLIEKGIIGAMQGEPEFVNTGLSDFDIIPISNVKTTGRATGFDDYTDIDTIVSDLMVRVAQIDRILDKHASPSVQGPATALEKDPKTNEWRLKLNNFFARANKDDPELKYLTWDGQLDSNFKQIELLINLLYTISEMGSAIFGDLSTKTGQIPSGSALRRLLISPLAKVNRIRMRLDPGLKKAIRLCSELPGYEKIEKGRVTISWNDGLPGDPKEEAEIMDVRTGGKATMSVKRALKVYDRMNDKDADEEIETILDEQEQTNPFTTPPGSTSEGDNGSQNNNPNDNNASENNDNGGAAQ